MLDHIGDDGVTPTRSPLPTALGDHRADLVVRHTFDALAFLCHWSAPAVPVFEFTFCTVLRDLGARNRGFFLGLTFSHASFLATLSIFCQPGTWTFQALVTFTFS